MTAPVMMFWGFGTVSIVVGAWMLFLFGDVLGALRRYDKAKRMIRSAHSFIGVSACAFLIVFGAFLWSLT